MHQTKFVDPVVRSEYRDDRIRANFGTGLPISPRYHPSDTLYSFEEAVWMDVQTTYHVLRRQRKRCSIDAILGFHTGA